MRNSGMALKVNSGEAAARTIVVNKAIALDANCIIGVDIDYGTTANKAATVTTQGTTVVIRNLAEVLSEDMFERVSAFETALAHANDISCLHAGDLARA